MTTEGKRMGRLRDALDRLDTATTDPTTRADLDLVVPWARQVLSVLQLATLLRDGPYPKLTEQIEVP